MVTCHVSFNSRQVTHQSSLNTHTDIKTHQWWRVMSQATRLKLVSYEYFICRFKARFNHIKSQRKYIEILKKYISAFLNAFSIWVIVSTKLLLHYKPRKYITPFHLSGFRTLGFQVQSASLCCCTSIPYWWILDVVICSTLRFSTLSRTLKQFNWQAFFVRF